LPAKAWAEACDPTWPNDCQISSHAPKNSRMFVTGVCASAAVYAALIARTIACASSISSPGHSSRRTRATAETAFFVLDVCPAVQTNFQVGGAARQTPGNDPRRRWIQPKTGVQIPEIWEGPCQRREIASKVPRGILTGPSPVLRRTGRNAWRTVTGQYPADRIRTAHG